MKGGKDGVGRERREKRKLRFNQVSQSYIEAGDVPEYHLITLL